ncbi:unnamed protein product, partial [Rhizoctonia solani]
AHQHRTLLLLTQYTQDMDPYRSQSGGSRGYASSTSPSASASSPNSTSSSSSSSACTYCHERKRRCVYEGPNSPCRRCRRAKRQCIPRQRAPRARPQDEGLSEDAIKADLQEMNEEIDRVLERYTRLTVSRRPYWEVQEVLDQLANLPPTHFDTDNARAVFVQRADQYWQEGV